MSAEAEPEHGNEELVKQDSNMWEFEGAPEGEDAESPATNGQPDVKAEDKDGDMTMGDAAATNAGSKHAPIPTPAKAGEVTKTGMPAQAQQAKQPGPKFGSGVNQGKAFEGRRQHRYFVLKSKSMFNVDQSVEKGIWATQVCHCIPSMANSQLSHHKACHAGSTAWFAPPHSLYPQEPTSDKTPQTPALRVQRTIVLSLLRTLRGAY